jgi:hypothetical protein
MRPYFTPTTDITQSRNSMVHPLDVCVMWGRPFVLMSEVV